MRTTARTRRAGGQDRWLLSYADLVTLLLAFFVTMYAVSNVDASKLVPAASSMQQAFEGRPRSHRADAGRRLGRAAGAGRSAACRCRQTLRLQAGRRDQAGRLELIRDARGLVVSLPESATFPRPAPRSPTARASSSRAWPPSCSRRPSDAHRRAHRQRADPHVAVPIELGALDGAGQRRGRVSDRGGGLRPGALSAAGYGEFHPRAPTTRRRTARATGASIS